MTQSAAGDPTTNQLSAAKKTTVYTTVKMDDDRLVEFPGKRKLVKESLFREDGTIAVRLDFANGETRLFELPEPLLGKFAAHGAEQKLGDEMAGLQDVEDCIVAVDDLIDRLSAGDWSIRREAGLAGASILLRALMEATGKSVEVIRKFLSEKTQAEKVALRSDIRLAAIVERLESEKVKKAPVVDTGALLAQLD